MRHIPAMVDMKRTPAEKEEAAESCVASSPSGPDYPWGLSISLTQDELGKLDMDGDAQVGDLIHMFCLAKITSISKRDNEQSGPDVRIELQITHIAVENEDAENEEGDRQEERRPKMSSLYKR